ncbi:MAG: thiamine ABC transporter substrate binding subunit [Halorientalis sp.]
MRRRRFLTQAGAGVGGVALLAGCSAAPADKGQTTGTPNGPPRGTLTVATYSSFTGDGAAGTWLKSAFEKEYPKVTVKFETPENGFNQYIQRQQQGAPLGADMYVGLNTGELVRADQKLDDDILRSFDGIEGRDAVKEGLRIDPNGRAVPYDTGYISLVYDEDEVQNPGTFDALLDSRYEGALITENAQQSDTGRAFLLWTILAKGNDGYLDYWSSLLDNGARVLSDWEPAYQAYTNGEAPMVVSYSTDQVYYHGPDVNMAKHQVGFLDDQGYANPEAMGVFADAKNPRLGRLFMEFVLTERAQEKIAVKNVQFPAVEGVTPGEEFSKYALEPPEPVTFSYDDLAGNVETWVDDWARLVASH